MERRKRDKREAREDGAGNLATRFKRMVPARRVRVMSKGFLNDGDELEDRVANNRCFCLINIGPANASFTSFSLLLRLNVDMT